MVLALAADKDKTGFGERLRALRATAGMTQKQLAEKCGFKHYQNVARLERGDRTPSWETVLGLAAALGVTPDAFLSKPGGD